MAVAEQRILPPEFLEAAGKTYLSDLAGAAGGYKAADLSKVYGPDFVAGKDELQTKAEELALSGIGAYKDYLTTLIICPAMRQIHEATLCYTKKHFKRMGGFSTTGFGEGGKMVDGCNESFFIKTEVASCMICICHTENSVKKDQFCTEKNKVIIDLKDGLQNHMKILKDMFRDCQEDLCCQDRVQK